MNAKISHEFGFSRKRKTSENKIENFNRYNVHYASAFKIFFNRTIEQVCGKNTNNRKLITK